MSINTKKTPKRPEAELRQIIGFTKPKKFLFFKTKPKPIYGAPIAKPPSADMQQVAAQTDVSAQQMPDLQPMSPEPVPSQEQVLQKPRGIGFMDKKQKPAKNQKASKASKETYQIFNQQTGQMEKPHKPAPAFLDKRIKTVANKQKDLELSMHEQNIKGTPYTFIQRIMYISIILAVVVAIAVSAVFLELPILDPAVNFPPMLGIILGVMFGIVGYMVVFNNLILFPIKKARNSGKEIEKDVLFAARDMIIAMRSGMPLYNAIVTVSTGYGAASREFGKIVETVQLGTPIENAIDNICAKSKSPTFNRIMLQSSTSIKAGADVIGALQEAIDEVSQERVIELRRYGQRLNALAMFYMLFGIIFPSMGIAVVTIMTTFISIITVDNTTLAMAFVGIVFLQVVFLNMIKSARPVYAS
jgi:flagellar protein FlaJ